ncbi:hypothetical protein KM043_015645 [Ampulex compressa]|nr:hypothetical protein KM043_015645 [Ampulex compressa]
MGDVETVLSDIYNNLLRLRYPDITRAEAKDVERTILSGDYRISLLSWLLTEKSHLIATNLGKLKGSALEDELLKYYSQIGICNSKDVLLGNCLIEEQLPTLKLLLEFIKNVHLETFCSARDTKETIDNILKMYITEDKDMTSALSSIKPKLNSVKTMLYLENLDKDLLYSDNPKIQLDKSVNEQEDTSMDVEQQINSELTESFSVQKEKFIEAFASVASWQPSNLSNVNSTSTNMDMDIQNIYSDFSTFKQVLQVKDSLSKIIIPKEINTFTPLNDIIEDAVICIERIGNISTGNQAD